MPLVSLLEDPFCCSSELPSIDHSLHLLRKIKQNRDLNHANRLILELTSRGLDLHISIRDYIVPMLVECGSSASFTHQVFNRLPCANEYTWTSLIQVYIDNGFFEFALDLFTLMQSDGIEPTSYTLVALLKACLSLKDVEKGREIHSYVLGSGFHKNAYVGSTLIDLYSKCGCMDEARETFEQLPDMNDEEIVVRNALMAGYAENGYAKEALECLDDMKQHGVIPDVVTLVCGLKACGVIGEIEKGQILESEIIVRGFDSDIIVGNSLIGMYVNLGQISEALKVFQLLSVCNVVSWNTLISHYAEFGPWIEALNHFESMQKEKILPDFITFCCIIKACTNLRDLQKGQILHMEIMMKGFEQKVNVGNSLINMYVNCGCFLEAWCVVYGLRDRGVVTWNTLIASYTENGLGEEALKCFVLMQAENILPNRITLVSVFKACGSIGAIQKGYELHMEMEQQKFEMDVSIGNALIGMYAECGFVLRAEEIFNTMPFQNVASWIALIVGYTQNGFNQSALESFDNMNLHGVSPTNATFSSILKACGKRGVTCKGREIHNMIIKRGLENDVSVGNSLIDMYVNMGLLDEAQFVFDNLLVRDVVTWSSMIRGCGTNHEVNSAIYLFEAMQRDGVKPNAITFTCLLTACCHGRLITKGRDYFRTMRAEHHILPTIEHYTCMVDLLARSGNLHEAERFIEMLNISSQSIWAALLNSCRTYVEPELGIRCFSELVGVHPEDATWYVLMSSIHVSAGRCEDAFKIEEVRRHAGAKKKNARASIEVNGQIHTFTVGEAQCDEVSEMLKDMNIHIQEQRQFVDIDSVSKLIHDESKEASLCDHAEKVAIAFGLLNTPQGQTLRVTKNLKMCNECHSASKIISQYKKREIIVRDESCIHRFKDGVCSCGDAF